MIKGCDPDCTSKYASPLKVTRRDFLLKDDLKVSSLSAFKRILESSGKLKDICSPRSVINDSVVSHK